MLGAQSILGAYFEELPKHSQKSEELFEFLMTKITEEAISDAYNSSIGEHGDVELPDIIEHVFNTLVTSLEIGLQSAKRRFGSEYFNADDMDIAKAYARKATFERVSSGIFMRPERLAERISENLETNEMPAVIFNEA